MMMPNILQIVALTLACGLARPAIGDGGVAGAFGGGATDSGAHNCIPPEERARIAAAIEDYRRRFGDLSRSAGDGLVLYRFHPQGCNLFNDVVINQWVDLDAGAATYQSYNCDGWTYDGHAGIDSPIRWFEEQYIGVPVFAALDGVVVARADGNPDTNTSCAGSPPANFVVIDHGNGRAAYYLHLKNGSVAVTVGQNVRAGQQIGLTASSGCSTGPHLHFASAQNGLTYEPYAGGCRPGPSGWLVQPEPPTTAQLNDFGVTRTSPALQPGYPHRLTTHPQILTGDQIFYVWFRFSYLPPGSTQRFEFVRPNGTIAFSPTATGFNNTTSIRSGWWWRAWTVFDMQTIPGTWRIRVYLNEQQVIEAPVEVATTPTPGFNRPPEPIGLVLEPPAPTTEDVVFCRVQTSPTLDDLDWDLVRYRYVWRVNGSVVRDIVSAGQADALPRLPYGGRVQCTVTPSDGVVEGPAVVASVSVGCYANCDGSAVSPVLNVNDFACFLNQFAAGDAYANCDGSSSAPVLNVNDFACYLNQFAAGCP